ncbi:hypothetical protein CCACVL1_01008 [Corchorus capsularis]|uniref:Uncharacterized protein n=1 Tax=Corchorus capsularis TaxID=210143 RepID=A0A1R3KT52_COCAP|nr:hypothetical protein CCACVL1_01008 [Corchorus capsularis]
MSGVKPFPIDVPKVPISAIPFSLKRSVGRFCPDPKRRAKNQDRNEA